MLLLLEVHERKNDRKECRKKSITIQRLSTIYISLLGIEVVFYSSVLPNEKNIIFPTSTNPAFLCV